LGKSGFSDFKAADICGKIGFYCPESKDLMAKLKSINPTTGEELGSVRIATKADVERVVEKARRAFPEWRDTPLVKRARIVKKIGFLLEKNSKSLSEMITLEMGKPLPSA